MANVDLQIADVRTRLADRRVFVEVASTAREFIARQGYDPDEQSPELV